jgi:hypothetical protein
LIDWLFPAIRANKYELSILQYGFEPMIDLIAKNAAKRMHPIKSDLRQ